MIGEFKSRNDGDKNSSEYLLQKLEIKFQLSRLKKKNWKTTQGAYKNTASISSTNLDAKI